MTRGRGSNMEGKRKGPGGYREPADDKRCTAPGCRKPTRDGKPVCGDHLDRLPYAARVMGDVEQGRDAERTAT